MSRDPLSDFYDEIRLKGAEDYQVQIDSVFDKLEAHYYDEGEREDHGLVVGSLGRGTAVAGASDVDLLFVLPKDVYSKFDSYGGNGQSALLQEVKGVMRERYPRTEIKGDGQAVVIDFKSLAFSIDLVPAFQQDDGSYKFPDTHSGGSWKKTNPIPEQQACSDLFAETADEALHLCNSLRVWKNHIGLSFKGLLIDTLVASFFEKREPSLPRGFDECYDMLVDLFGALASEDRDKDCWHALGSNQLIYNCDRGAFVPKAKKAKDDLLSAETKEEKDDALSRLFGKRFADFVGGESSERALAERYNTDATEEFIGRKFKLDVRYSLSIDCRVTQNGFRPYLLWELLRSRKLLPVDKGLEFFVERCDVPEPYDVYWKVRNVGEAAYQRNCVRGQIVRDGGKLRHLERTQFRGPHYVECYAVKNGVCVARARIDVPIEEGGLVS